MIPLAVLLACEAGRDGTPDPDSGEPSASGITVELAAPTVPLVQTVEVTVSETVTIELLCTDDHGEGDEITLTDASGTTLRKLVVAGLLADTPYTCTVTSGDDRAGFSFATPALDAAFEMNLGGTGPADGYTLVYHLIWDETGWNFHHSDLFVVDPLARIRWYLDLGSVNIDLDAHVLDGNRVLYGGALTIPPTVVGIDQEQILQFDTKERFHHQIEPLSDGRILTLTEVENTDGVHTWIGFLVSVRDLATQEILWSWSSQTAVDAGDLPVSNDGSDPYHANSAQLLEAEDEPHLMLVSLRNLDRILAIDTDTGEVPWTIGRGGDFAFLDEKGDPLPDDQWFEGQHSLEARWPRILLFDNGPHDTRADGTSTRALEIAVDTEKRSVTKTWAYADGPEHEGLGGDANRLASGNVLMTSPHCLPCDASDAHSKIVEVTPEGEVVWRIDFGDERDLLYRSERVDPCTLFSNRAYCPSL